MSYPKAYDPQEGYKYQILTRLPGYREWEHLDYAVDKNDLLHLRKEYNLCMRGFQFKNILLPQKYWPKTKKERANV